ncbi:hypothetical protein EPO33_02030 [Patescibacteria group bacterium]|nr:MAG: hypothetical protein EPO33_02030 [Patescibacteria group bacterium]
MKGIVTTIFAVLLLGAGCAPASSLPQGTLWGVSLSPASFSATDFPAFFAKAKEAGGLLTWGGRWQDLTQPAGAPHVVAQEGRRQGLAIAIVTQPTPAEIANPVQRAAFRDAVVAFAKERKPDFIGLGNEINREYDDKTLRSFAELFTETRAAVKQSAPDAQVFPVFQYEWLLGRRGGLYGGKDDPSKAQWELLALFPDADLIAFTFYPALAFKEPSDIPADYFSQVRSHTNKRIAVTETGWFRQGAGGGWESDAKEAADYVRRLPELVGGADPRFVVWSFLYDQAAAPRPFGSAGLLGAGQTTSPAWEAWKEITH